MRICLLFSLYILALQVSHVSAQTALDIERAYGKPVAVYSLSENIWMTPQYAADGQVCMMRLYPKRIMIFPLLVQLKLRLSPLNGMIENALGTKQAEAHWVR